MRGKPVSLVFAFGFVVAAGMGAARAQTAGDAAPRAPGVLVPTMSGFREAYLAGIFQPFRNAAGDDQILTASDIARARSIAAARQRASTMQQFFSADLDADNRLTAEEIRSERRKLPNQSPAWDTDEDGVVTLDEAMAYARRSVENRDFSETIRLSQLLELDPDKDGQLTSDELERLGRAAFAAYDRDGNGMLSPAENELLKQDRTKAQAERAVRQRAARCNVPKVDPGQKLLVVSSYEAGALSNVAVAGQDEETETAELVIEAGDEPLYIAVSSYEPMIWRVSGHVERVARFVGSARRGIGVVGLPREKLTLTGADECLQRIGDGAEQMQSRMEVFAAIFGKPVDGLVAGYTVQKATLPADAVAPIHWKSGQEQRAPSLSFSAGGLSDVDRETFASFKRFSPGGLVPIDPATVVASGAAERYQVLPQEAGLLQLIGEGSIENLGRRTYLVKEPIARFPPGLAGAHSVRFLLAKGVPRPAGNPGHSIIVTENEVLPPSSLRGMQRK